MASMDKNLFEFSDDTNMSGGLSQEDLFSLLEMFDDGATGLPPLSPLDEIMFSPKGDNHDNGGLVAIKSTSLSTCANSEIKESPRNKKAKLLPTPSSEEEGQDGEHRILHINVERNRRRQMNDNLSVLRSLMPPFYVKRGDQASIIGGVVDYIKELQQILKSLEMKKQRKIYSEVLSPRVVSSPRPSPLSPRKPPLSPRISLPISPRTPTRTSPYKDTMQQAYMPPTSPFKTTTIQQQGYMSMSPTISTSRDDPYASPCSSVAMKPTAPEVEVKLQGSNVVLQTKSTRIHGQIVKILEALEALSLEILHVSISSLDDTMLNSFTIKIGIECQLSAEELAHEIQQTFC